MITFDNIGASIIGQTELNNLSCNNLPTTNTTNLNSYTTAERFSIMMCALIDNNLAHTTDWSHDLFGNNVFSVTTYQQQLANFIFEEHDWASEPSIFKLAMQTEFGADWKQKVSELSSWFGMEKTNEFAVWANANNIQFGFDADGFVTGEFATYKSLARGTANKNCN